MKSINKAFSEKRLGSLQEPFETRLQEQVAWLVKAAGITDEVVVNNGVATTRLDVIVTTPDFFSLTYCGRGNAIYDPVLDTIFVDYSLIVPEDMYLMGSDDGYSMVSPKTSDIHYPYQNFILAHELGHRQNKKAKSNSVPFFDYSAMSRDVGDWEDEAAADRFAVKTILNGIVNLGPPKFQIYFDTLGFFELDLESISPIDHAAAEIVGAVVIMSYVLLFSNSPYSPFHFDKNHPTFIDRTLAALERVEGLNVSEKVAAHFAFFSAGIEAMKKLPAGIFRELYFTDAVLRIVNRGDELWFGTHRLPASEEAAIYRLHIEDIMQSRSGDYLLAGREPIALFEEQDPNSDFSNFSEYSAVGWLLDAFDRPPQPQQSDDGGLQGAASRETVVPTPHVTSSPAVLLPSQNLQEFVSQHGLLLKAATSDDGVWWIPAFPPYGDDEPQSWALWQYRIGSTPTKVFHAPLLISQAGTQSTGEFLRYIDPYIDGVKILSDGRILVWIQGDSMYLYDPQEKKSTVLFTPIYNGLQLMEISKGKLLIWMKNGLKAYLTDLDKI